MGVLRPLVKRSQSMNKNGELEPSDKWVTPANAMTASRPILGAIAAKKLVQGKPKAAVWAMVAAATDMEGIPARKIDEWKPEWHRGRSKKGKLGDPGADSSMLAELTIGTLFAPKVSLLGKLALVIVGAQETIKAVEAVSKDKEHRALTGEHLNVPITDDGKEAMIEKMGAAGLAILTNEFEHPVVRLGLGMTALGFAIAGAARGHAAHRENMRAADEIMANFQTPVEVPTSVVEL
jgi:phosphatidylglycerophosphate synthase